MSLWPGTVIPRWRTSPSMAESGVSKTSAFRFVLWTVCSPYPNLNLRRTIFSSRRCTDLEQSSAAYLICSVTSCLLLSLEDILLRTLLPVILLSCLRSDTVIYGHVNRSYLLPQRCNFEWRAAKFRTTWSVATSVRQLSFLYNFISKWWNDTIFLIFTCLYLHATASWAFSHALYMAWLSGKSEVWEFPGRSQPTHSWGCLFPHHFPSLLSFRLPSPSLPSRPCPSFVFPSS